MFSIEQSVTIGRPAHEVFAFLADTNNIPLWRPDVVEARSGDQPLRLGGEFDEVIQFGGRKTQTFRVSAFEPDETLEVAAIAGLGIRPTQRYALSTVAGTTTVSIRVTVRTYGLFRLLEPFLPRMIGAKWHDYADRLRGLLEGRPVVASHAVQSAPIA